MQRDADLRADFFPGLQCFEEADARVLTTDDDQAGPVEDLLRQRIKFVGSLDPLQNREPCPLSGACPRCVTLVVFDLELIWHRRAEVVAVEEKIALLSVFSRP